MNILLEELTDDDIRYIVKNDLSLFIEPIKRNQKRYLQYTTVLGNMSKKSLLVQKNLPSVVVKLYRRQDMLYVKAIEFECNRLCENLIGCINEIFERDVPLVEILQLSDEDIADILGKFQGVEKHVVEMELLRIQMKLIGFENVDERISSISELCGIEIETSEEQQENKFQVKEPSEKKNPTAERKIKTKKLTPEEKAAKTKAAVEAKAKRNNEIESKAEEIIQKECVEDEHKYEEENEPQFQTINDIMEEKEMNRYIGVVNTKSNFYNFTPIGTYENGTYLSFSENDIDKLLVKSIKHNINFYYNYWDESQAKFMKEKFPEGYPVLLNCEIEELDENRLPDGELNATGYKITAMDAWNKRKIGLLSDIGLYVLLSKEDLLDEDIETRRVIRIEKEGLVEGTQVLVNLGDGFYAGPCTVKYSPTNYTMFIVMQAAEGKHYINGYNASDCKRVIVDVSEEVGNWIGHSSWCYYTIKKNAAQISKDYISDRDLLESFKVSLEKTKELDYANLDIDGIINRIGESQIVGSSIIPNDIKEQRIQRIKEIMSSEEELNSLYADASELMCALLIKNKDNKQTEQLLTEIISRNRDLIESTPGVRAMQLKVDSLRSELEQLENKKIELQEIINNSSESEEIKEDNNEYQEISEELSIKKKELTLVLERIGVAETAVDLQKEIEQLKDEVKYYESYKSHLVSDTKNLSSKFVEFINGYADKMADITFDGFMSSKMLQAANEWEAKVNSEELEFKVEAINKIQEQGLERIELLEYLIDMVKKERPGYSRNTIINIFVCASQGFLTVFSGLPGCGKTSICNIVSRVLGLNGYEVMTDGLNDENRFISVSVERGWTSKRDFIGYYNPLTKAYEESNMKVFNGLKLLDMEKRKGYKKWPFFILLDEANLSPMEYYWADFMNVCDDLNDRSSINLGNEKVFNIPETLHFLATINNDHTTETLSPRLIDRAWIITLPKFSSQYVGENIIDEQIKNISWNELKNVFTISGYKTKSYDRETQVIYEGIKEMLSKQMLYISPRVEIAIKKYWIVASELMDEDEYGNSANLVALDYAVSQKILPKIIGSGEGYEMWLKEFQTYCDNKGLLHSSELLKDIINRGNNQMKYYQFFI